MLKFILGLFSKSAEPVPAPVVAPAPVSPPERQPGESVGAYTDRVLSSDARPANVGEFLTDAINPPPKAPQAPARRNINAAGLKLIKSWESFVAYPYDDLLPPVKGVYREWTGGPVTGTLTIGYGHTDAAKHPLKVKAGLRITEVEACEILDVDLDECEDAVARLVKVPLTDNQFSALVSFQFNTGSLASSTLLKKLNAGDYRAVPEQLLRWVHAKGRYVEGLKNRRNAEIALWNTP